MNERSRALSLFPSHVCWGFAHCRLAPSPLAEPPVWPTFSRSLRFGTETARTEQGPDGLKLLLPAPTPAAEDKTWTQASSVARLWQGRDKDLRCHRFSIHLLERACRCPSGKGSFSPDCWRLPPPALLHRDLLSSLNSPSSFQQSLLSPRLGTPLCQLRLRLRVSG